MVSFKDGHKASAMQQTIIDALRVKKDGQCRYAGVCFYVNFSGMQNLGIYPAMQKSFPCAVTIHGATGDPVEKSNPHSSPCGVSRFCGNCTRLMSFLGRCSDLASTTDMMAHVWDTAMNRWIDGVLMDCNYSYLAQPVHHCRDNCEFCPAKPELPVEAATS